MRSLASPHPFLGATTSLRPCSRSSSSPSCSCSGVPQTQFTIRVLDIPVVCNWLRGGAALLSRCASFDSGYIFCVSSRLLLNVFSTRCGTRLLKSILSCSPLWPRTSLPTAAVCASWFLVSVHLALCSLRYGDVAQLTLRLLYLPESGNYFHEPLFFAVICSPSGHCEGSGWRGRRESDSQVTCHPN